jgi:glyoxylase-like metal-dependent hydrolase (beta-lactamase superfamily II)
MKTIASGIYLESRYPAVHLGAVASDGSILLIDTPLRTEDLREWQGQLADHGRPRHLVLLDHHPDRSLGARGTDVTVIGQDRTRQVMANWPDTFKGSARPFGAEADKIKRITGVSKAVPELSFSDELLIHLGKRVIVLWHRPGPMPGSLWVLVPELHVAFIGDTVMLDEPPFLGEADVPAWREALAELASSKFKEYTLVSSRDGVVDRAALQAMGRLLGRVDDRLAKMRSGSEAEATGVASGLVKSYKLGAARREAALLRLTIGVQRLYARQSSAAAG